MISRPSTVPTTPRPGTFRNSVTTGRAPELGARARATARATGCSLALSTAPASAQRLARVTSRSAARRPSSRSFPSVTVPVLSSTIVVTRRVLLEHLRAPDQDAELRAAAGADQQRRRRREAESARARDDQDRDGRREGCGHIACERPASRRASPATSPSTTGTKTAETRSTSRWIGAFPACASATSRAICATAVSAPTRVARTTSRPYELIVPPATSAPGPTSTGSDSPVSSDWSIADAPSSTTPSVAICSPGRTTKRSPTRELFDRDDDLDRRRAARAPPSRRARAAPESPRPTAGARGLEEPAQQDQRRDHARDLEVHVRIDARDEDDGRPGERGERADRDQRVHRRRAVARVHERRPVERPAAPERRSASRARARPTPSRRTGAAGSSRAARAERSALRRRRGDARRWTCPAEPPLRAAAPGSRRPRRPRPGHSERRRRERDGRALGRVVHRRLDAVQLVQLPLDPGRARGARHPFDRQLEPLGAHRHAAS